MPQTQPTFPLSVSANHRYLVDGAGQPYLVHGDTAWSIITSVTKAEAEQYLTNRAAKGVNALIINLIEHKFNGPFTRAGEHPFTDPQDLSTPNDKYFDYADWVLRRAAELGMLVFLAPMYLGYRHPADDDGWYHEAHLGGMNKCWKYGRYLGKRYAGFNNIVWMMGGDRNPDGVVDEVNSLMTGIKEFDKHALFAAHAHPEETTADKYGWGGWLDLNSTYTYMIVHKKLLADYNRRPVMPFVLMESSYEGEHNASPVQIRRQAYWAMLSGACGQFLGNNPIWLFNPGWKDALEFDRLARYAPPESLFYRPPLAQPGPRPKTRARHCRFRRVQRHGLPDCGRHRRPQNPHGLPALRSHHYHRPGQTVRHAPARLVVQPAQW